jgi:predicted amino acid-binding ACT domain protein
METKTAKRFDYDQEKAMLVKKTTALERSMEGDLETIKEYVEEYGKNALVIAGTLIATYTLLRILVKTSEEEKDYKTISTQSEVYAAQPQQVVRVVKEESEVMKQIKMSIALFLVSLAKQKLQEFLATKMEETK